MLESKALGSRAGLESSGSPGGLTEMSPVPRPGTPRTVSPGKWGWRRPGAWGSPYLTLLGPRPLDPSRPGVPVPGSPALSRAAPPHSAQAALTTSGSPRLEGVKRPGLQEGGFGQQGGWKRSPVSAFLPLSEPRIRQLLMATWAAG